MSAGPVPEQPVDVVRIYIAQVHRSTPEACWEVSDSKGRFCAAETRNWEKAWRIAEGMARYFQRVRKCQTIIIPDGQ